MILINGNFSARFNCQVQVILLLNFCRYCCMQLIAFLLDRVWVPQFIENRTRQLTWDANKLGVWRLRSFKVRLNFTIAWLYLRLFWRSIYKTTTYSLTVFFRLMSILDGGNNLVRIHFVFYHKNLTLVFGCNFTRGGWDSFLFNCRKACGLKIKIFVFGRGDHRVSFC